MSSSLKKIIESLDSLIENEDARLSVVVETGYDEAGFVGTNDAYLRFAKVLVEFVAAAQENRLEKWKIGERELPGSTTIGHVSDSACEIGFDSMCLTTSEIETRNVVDYFLKMSPPYSEAEIRVV